MQTDSALLGHWPLAGDTRDASGGGNHAENRGADLTAPGPPGRPAAARLRGDGGAIVVPRSAALRLGTGDFSLALWVNTSVEDDVVGDIANKYDPVRRRGLNLGIQDF